MPIKKNTFHQLLMLLAVVTYYLFAPLSADAAFWMVDNFTSGTVMLSSTGPLQSSTGVGLENVAGGERYAYVDRTGPSGSVSLGVNTFPFIGAGFFTSSSSAYGIGGLSYGRTTPLNLDFDRDGLIFGFRLTDFGADLPAQTGTIRLTVHSDTGTDNVAKSIAVFQNNPGWLHEEFSGVNFANVTRLDLDWYGFTAEGADLEFTAFGTFNYIPEPGTLVLLGLASVMVYALRRNHSAADLRA